MNVSIHDSTVLGSVNLIKTNVISQVKVENVSLVNFSYEDPKTQTGTYCLNLKKISLSNNKYSYIRNITASNYDLGVLKFGGFTGTPPTGVAKEFRIEKIEFSEVVYTQSTIVIWI